MINLSSFINIKSLVWLKSITSSEKSEFLTKSKLKIPYPSVLLTNLLVDKSELSEKILVKVRSTGKLLEAAIKLKHQNKAEVNLKELEDGISPGQACVFYSKDDFGDKLLGGGWIHKTYNKNLST